VANWGESRAMSVIARDTDGMFWTASKGMLATGPVAVGLMMDWDEPTTSTVSLMVCRASLALTASSFPSATLRPEYLWSLKLGIFTVTA
jgi:hypothetical protein